MGIRDDLLTVIKMKKGNVARIFSAYTATFTLAALEVASPFLLIYSISATVNENDSTPERLFAASLYGLYWGGAKFLHAGRRVLLSPLKSDLAAYLTTEVMEKYYKQPLLYRKNFSNAKEVQFYITNYVRVGEGFAIEINDSLIPSLINVVAIEIALIVLYRLTSGVIAALTAIYAVSAVYGSRRVANAEEKLSTARFKGMAQINTRLGRYIEATSFNRVDFEMSQLGNALYELNTEIGRRDTVGELVSVLQSSLISVIFILSIMMSGVFFTEEINEFDDFLKILFYTMGFANALDEFSRSLNVIMGTKKVYDKVKAHLNERHVFSDDHELPDFPEPVASSAPAIELREVSHSYGSTMWALYKVTLQIPQNGIVFVVGQSGSGKSTLLQLLNKSYPPSEGEVLLHGGNLSCFNRASINERVAFISQEAALSNASIRENVFYALPTASEADVSLAIQEAKLQEVVDTFGEMELIGEGGSKLSGGQKQRLNIARAILKMIASKASIVLADEPTSALDPESRREIMSILFGLSSRVTIFMITHDLSLIDGARDDQIVVMEKGRVVEEGAFSSLIALKGVFHAQYSLAQISSKISGAEKVLEEEVTSVSNGSAKGGGNETRGSLQQTLGFLRRASGTFPEDLKTSLLTKSQQSLQ